MCVCVCACARACVYVSAVSFERERGIKKVRERVLINRHSAISPT